MWNSAHIDELYTEERTALALRDMLGRSVAGIFSDAVTQADDMEAAHDIEINMYDLHCVMHSRPVFSSTIFGVKTRIIETIS